MRKNRVLLTIMTGLCLILLGGCGLKMGEEFTEEVNTLEGAGLTVEEADPAGIVYIIDNLSDRDLSYGQDYGLQAEKDGKWYQIEPNGQAAVTLELLTVPAGRSERMELNWESAYGKLPKGSYRLIKSVSDTEQGYYLAGEFRIE